MEKTSFYNDFFWGEKSFSKSLEDNLIWDITKYWELELFLIKLIKNEFSYTSVDRNLSAELYFLGRFIDKCVHCTINPRDFWSIENISEEELLTYYDRFNHIMRVLWGKIKFNPDDYFFYENPLYKKML